MPRGVPKKHYPEYDNNIHDFRIELGYTVQKLSELIDINPIMLTNIACGYYGPFKVNGTEKAWVSKLCKVFNKKISEIWPFELCEIKPIPGNINDYVYDQIVSEFCSQYTLGYSVCKKIDVTYYLSCLTQRSRSIFIKYYALEETLDEIAKDYSLTREGVRQINISSMRKIRRKSHESNKCN